MHAHTGGQLDGMAGGPRKPDHLAHQDTRYLVVTDLFRRVLLGVEQQCEGVVGAVPSGIGAGCLDGVPDPSLDGQSPGVDPRAEVNGDLDVAEFHGRRNAMNLDVGGTERGPQVVRVAADP